MIEVVGAVHQHATHDFFSRGVLEWARHGNVIHDRLNMRQMPRHVLFSQTIHVIAVTVSAFDQPKIFPGHVTLLC